MNLFRWEFNFFYSVPFWISAILVALGGRIFIRRTTGRHLFLGLTSVLMLLAIPGFSPAALGLIFALSLLTYAIGTGLLKSSTGPRDLRRKLAAGAGIAAVLAFLAFFKYRFIQGLFLPVVGTEGSAPTGMIRMIGVSYFSFRMIHFLVEAYRKKILDRAPLVYIDYIIFFPAFISGPINRFNHFASQVRSPSGSTMGADLRAGGERIIHGLFKKLVLAQLLYPHILSTRLDVLSGMGLLDAAIGLYAYALYFYFDFAGYSDLAIGCARLIGIELPENFNSPFLKRNIRELWTNWHMSLTSWLVDYIYWPIVRKFRGLEYFRRHPVFLSNLGMIITFIGCGMWHGETVNFILWGAYHGVGISILTIYQREKRKARSPVLQNYFRSRTSAVLGAILTFNFFALGLSLFVLDIGKLRILAASILSRL
ncbi:MAG TPA: MBOAT family O-acyltransferase [Acidobacteriota bacterium]|nr:MBOAT family O-acyltransferase [Acidobacteriota bacterium]